VLKSEDFLERLTETLASVHRFLGLPMWETGVSAMRRRYATKAITRRWILPSGRFW
jgi:hypothetical protein